MAGGLPQFWEWIDTCQAFLVLHTHLWKKKNTKFNQRFHFSTIQQNQTFRQQYKDHFHEPHNQFHIPSSPRPNILQGEVNRGERRKEGKRERRKEKQELRINKNKPGVIT